VACSGVRELKRWASRRLRLRTATDEDEDEDGVDEGGGDIVEKRARRSEMEDGCDGGCCGIWLGSGEDEDEDGDVELMEESDDSRSSSAEGDINRSEEMRSV
jgi:hypothetical protein